MEKLKFTSIVNNEETLILENYSIEKTLGKGTFGKVKLGIHKQTKEKVAIKILEKKKILDKDDLERVNREIKYLKKLNHKHVIKIYEIIEDEKNYFIIMEYAEGGELFKYIVKRKHLDDQEASFFFIQIISGLEYIHTNNIVHRDLKPENLLLTNNNQIKIIDFGLSNTYNQGELLTTPCGSPCYAAPEMILGKKYSGLLVDIWSTGIILYAMVFGFLPFEDKNSDALYTKIIECNLKWPKPISDATKSMIKRLLTVDPKKRIKIDEIKQHVFYQISEIQVQREITDYDYSFSKEMVLAKMEELGMKKDEIIRFLEKNRHNNITTTYYLLLRKYSNPKIQRKCKSEVTNTTKINKETFDKNKNIDIIEEIASCREKDEKEKPKDFKTQVKPNINININYLKNIGNININFNEANFQKITKTDENKNKLDKSTNTVLNKLHLNNYTYSKKNKRINNTEKYNINTSNSIESDSNFVIENSLKNRFLKNKIRDSNDVSSQRKKIGNRSLNIYSKKPINLQTEQDNQSHNNTKFLETENKGRNTEEVKGAYLKETSINFNKLKEINKINNNSKSPYGKNDISFNTTFKKSFIQNQVNYQRPESVNTCKTPFAHSKNLKMNIKNHLISSEINNPSNFLSEYNNPIKNYGKIIPSIKNTSFQFHQRNSVSNQSDLSNIIPTIGSKKNETQIRENTKSPKTKVKDCSFNLNLTKFRASFMNSFKKSKNRNNTQDKITLTSLSNEKVPVNRNEFIVKNKLNGNVKSSQYSCFAVNDYFKVFQKLVKYCEEKKIEMCKVSENKFEIKFEENVVLIEFTKVRHRDIRFMKIQYSKGNETAVKNFVKIMAINIGI